MSNHDLKGFHHFYLGLAALIGGFILIWYNMVACIIVLLTGFILCIDDAVQHIIGVHLDETYRSPLHRLYGWLYRKSAFIRWLNGLFDKLFGKE